MGTTKIKNPKLVQESWISIEKRMKMDILALFGSPLFIFYVPSIPVCTFCEAIYFIQAAPTLFTKYCFQAIGQLHFVRDSKTVTKMVDD